MMRSTTRWTTAIAAAALLTVSPLVYAQVPSPASQPSAGQQAPTPQEPTSPSSPSSPAAQDPAASTQRVDPETVKRHLTAARDALSQMTQLPAAAQLSGDARTQVSQLITNFNELISTNTDWRGSLSKVQGNVSALVGDQRADESPAPAAGAAGAVGTSGTVTLDPSLKAKLIEFRTHLAEFEKAATGGGGAPSEPAPSAPTPSSPPAASSSPSPSSPAEPAASPSPSEPAASPTRSEPTASPSPQSPSGEPGAVGTSGSTPAAESPSAQSGSKTQPASKSGRPADAAHSDAVRHIEAIEAILAGRSDTGAAAGKPAGTSGGSESSVTLTAAQIQQIKTHLNELRNGLSQSGGR